MSAKTKKSIFVRLRNYFITGAIVLIPIGITVYLSLFIVKISSSFLPKKINPNHYLPFDIPGIEILITIILITFIGGLSLSFLGKKFLELFTKHTHPSSVGPTGVPLNAAETVSVFSKKVFLG